MNKENPFISGLPNSVKIRDTKYRVRTGFATWMKFGETMAAKLDPTEKLYRAITLCFDADVTKRLPPNPVEMMSALCDFYSVGKKTEKGDTKRRAPVLDFARDWDSIYASFYSEYGIDLFSEDLHWYRFVALLGGLSEDAPIMKKMYYRSVDPNTEKNPTRRKYLRKMKRAYALPDTRTAAERETDFAECMAELF